MSEPLEIEILPHRPLGGLWKELWQARELGWALVNRDFRVRYQDTVLGAAWAILQPLANMLIFSFLLGRLGKLPSHGTPYPLFIYCALLPWFLFSNSVSNASQSFLAASNVIKKIYFPRIIIIISSVMVNLIDFIISCFLLVFIFLYYRFLPGSGVLVVPLLILGVFLLALGTGTVLASLTVAYRDFRYVVPVLMQLWMFVTPVVYSTGLIPPKWHGLYYCNPMAGYVDGFRAALLGGPWPWTGLGLAVLGTVLVCWIGFRLFASVESRLADDL